MKTTSCTEQTSYAFDNAPRCGARTKHNNGKPCRCPAVKGARRCRIHGGAKGSGGQKNNQNALKHGLMTSKIKNFKKAVKVIINRSKQLITDITD